MRAATGLIERDLASRIPLSRLAAAVGLSPAGLRRLFKLSTGVSPSDYLHRLRFEHARRLLSQPDGVLRVKEVMASCGFTDASHFAREFKRRYGSSPRAYQRRAGEGRRAGESANRLAIPPKKPQM